ncbi:MAG: hypothetical protein ACRC2S_08290 [Waterburya sp.]
MKKIVFGAIASLFLASPSFASEAMSLAEYKEMTINKAFEISDSIMWICNQEEVKQLKAYVETNRVCQVHFSNLSLYVRIIASSYDSEEILDLTTKYLSNIKDILTLYELETKVNFEAFKQSMDY